METHVAASDPTTGPVPIAKINAIDLSGLGQGVSQLGHGAAIADRNAKRLVAQQDAKRDNLWVNVNSTQATKDMSKYLLEASLNPDKGIDEQFEKDFAAYSDKLISEAPSTDAADSMAVMLGRLETRLIPDVFRVKASANSLYADKSINEMVQASGDLLALTVSHDTLKEVSGNIVQAIDDMSGVLITPAAAEKYKREIVPELQMQAVDLYMIEDPKLARDILKDIRGISGSERAAKLNKIANVESQSKSVDMSLMNRAYKSQLENLRRGKKDPGFNIDEYIETLPSHKRVGARTIYNDDVAVANGYYEFTQAVQGKSPQQIDDELRKLKPSGDVEAGHRATELYKQVAYYAEAQKTLIKEDPYAASLQSPVIQQMEGTMDVSDVITASLQAQADMGVPEGMRKVADNTQLRSFANDLNHGSSKDKVTRINELRSIYGEYYPDLFRNLVGLPSGSRVSTDLSMVHEHLAFDDEGNDVSPPWIYNFLDASKATTKELGYTDTEANDFRNVVANNSDVLKLQKAMVGIGGVGALEQFGEVKETLSKYSMTLDSIGETRGKTKSVKKAFEQVVGSVYSFGEVNGTIYGIPRRQKNMTVTEPVAAKIEFALNAVLDVKMQDKYSPVFGKSGGFSSPFHMQQIGDAQFSFDDTVTEDYKQKFKETAIETHGYWATNPTGDGVVLKSKSSGTQRNGLVLDTHGNPINVSFEEAIAWADQLNKEKLIERDKIIEEYNRSYGGFGAR